MSREDGFSLIELLVATLVTLLLLGGLYSVLLQTQGVFEGQQDVADLRQQARVTVQQVATELRMAGYDIGSAPEMLPSAGASALSFVADIDDGSPLPPCGAGFEGATNGGAERVTFSLQGNTLMRSVDCWDGASWNVAFSNQAIANNVQGAQPIFRYFDESGTELTPGGGGTLSAADRDAVRTVEITLSLLDPDPQILGDPQANYQATTTIRLRNAGI